MISKTAKPFLKWAGGKTQLVKEIERAFPRQFNNSQFTYIESFVGSDTVLFLSAKLLSFTTSSYYESIVKYKFSTRL